jgi:hypothetical protein
VPLDGPRILASTLSTPRVPDRFGNLWQYHSRSDRHSKVSCWGIMFDLLQASSLLRDHVQRGVVTFGVNHEMSDFKTGRKKNLDLVLARPGADSRGRTLADVAVDLGLRLEAEQAAALRFLPPIEEGPVGSVLMALEAKACMTAHGKARPRLYDELNSSHLTVHGANDQAIAVGHVTVNGASTFVSPDLNKFDLATRPAEVTVHTQPAAASSVIEKVRELPRRTRPGLEGYDAIGVVVLDCANDGRPVAVVDGPPSPATSDSYNYAMMISRVTHAYDTQFSHI